MQKLWTKAWIDGQMRAIYKNGFLPCDDVAIRWGEKSRDYDLTAPMRQRLIDM